ncbi:hypothetical protein ACQ859_26815 [Roseateles chitinivorans]|uniref:hypothetical protein n=1 Tax=Roseateles chitinivorans TaxID=2917965 RepID=UPI003D675970
MSASRREEPGAVGGTSLVADVVGGVAVVEAVDAVDDVVEVLDAVEEADVLAEVLAVTNDALELLLELLLALLLELPPEPGPALPCAARRDDSAPPWNSPVEDAGREELPADGGVWVLVVASGCGTGSELSGFDATSFGMTDGLLLIEDCPCRG